MIVLNETSLYQHVKSFIAYYPRTRQYRDLCTRRSSEPWLRYRKLADFTPVRAARSLKASRPHRNSYVEHLRQFSLHGMDKTFPIANTIVDSWRSSIASGDARIDRLVSHVK